MTVFLYPPVYDLEEIDKYIHPSWVIVSSILWAQCMIEENKPVIQNWQPMWGPWKWDTFSIQQLTSLLASSIWLSDQESNEKYSAIPQN